MSRPSEWTATDSQVAALATATKAAQTNRRHVLCRVIASYSAAQIGILQVKNATTVVFEKYIHNSDVVELPEGLRNLLANQAVSAELAAGAGGVTGKVEIMGYSTSG